MSSLTVSLLFLAGVVSGAVNAMAGGGTFITFGALSLGGLPPITANATSSVTQFPGYVTSTLAYWDDIRKIWKGALFLCAISAVGALAGALSLMVLDNPSFDAIVPWLLLAATLIFAAGPWLKPEPNASRTGAGSRFAPVVQLVTAAYGGFFGAGMGIMMLAALGLTEEGDYHRLNALKNLLSIVIAAVAISAFIAGGLVSWRHVLVVLPGAAIGGYAGVWVAKRAPMALVRSFVTLIGLLLTAYYFYV